MADSIAKLRILARAESALLQLRVRRVAVQSALIVVAAVLLLITVGLLNLAAYQYLANRFAPHEATLLVALANASLAGILLIAAWRVSRRTEPPVAHELRELAWRGVQQDIEDMRHKVSGLRTNVGAVSSLLSGGSGGWQMPSLAPLLQLALQAVAILFRKRKRK